MSQTPSLKRKQQTISSFFAKTVPSPSSGGSTAEQKNGKRDASHQSTREIPGRSKSKPSPKVESNGTKQDVEEDEDDDEVILPVKKRIRSSAWKAPENESEKSMTGKHGTEEEEEEADEEEEDVRPSSPMPNMEPQSSASRAERFRFQSSPVQPPTDEQISPAERKKKDQLHQKFVRRLGGPDCLPSFNPHDGAPEVDPVAEGAASDEEEDDSPPPAPKGRAAKKAGGSKLTPMERQIMEIKNKHLDAVLLIQVGYKYQFYGEDARTAAKVLSIVCIPGKLRFDDR